MTRARLPDRRFAETVMLEHGGTRFMVTIGFYPDGRPGEVFTHGIRTGSGLDALLADACVVVSCLILVRLPAMCVAGVRKQPADPAEHQLVRSLEWQSGRRTPAQHNNLLPKHEDFCLQRRS